MRPSDLRLPEKFTELRPNQAAAIHFLRTSPKRVKALTAPTGFGKTATYVEDALHHPDEPTCVVTESRALQTQLTDEFGCVGMVDLRGRHNYPCGMRDDFTCEDGYAARCLHKGSIWCPASQAEIRASCSSLVTTNYAKWIHARRFTQGLAHIKRVVFDEGHRAPEALAQAMQVTLQQKEIEKTLGLDFLPNPESQDFANWKPWASQARDEAEARMIQAREWIQQSAHPRFSLVKHFHHMRHLTRRLSILATAKAANWIVEEIQDGFQFDPISVGPYAESSLLFRVPHIVIVSATLSPKALYMLGIAKDTFDWREYPSDFDPKDCPIYYIPTMRVDRKAPNLAMLWARLDQFAAKRRDRNGIVHTGSYLRRDDVLASSRFRDSMLINEKGEPPTEMIDEFRATYPGAILVSPSVGSGHDFPGAQCEWQFISKVPFPPTTKILEARAALDREYPYYLALQTLVQNVGRAVRYKGDRCENVIADDHIVWMLKHYGHLTPRSFRGFFKQVRYVPQPPPRIERQ